MQIYSAEKQQPLALRHGEKEWAPGALSTLFGVVTSIGNFFMAIYFKESLNFSGMEIGILFSLQAITGVLAAFPAGFGNDRLESRTLIAFSLVMMSLSYFVLGSQRIFLWVALAFFFWTLSQSIFRMSLDLQVLKSDDGGETGRRVGVYQLCRFVGMTIGTLVSGLIIYRFDFSHCLLFCAGGCLVLLLFVHLLKPTPVSAVRLGEYRSDLSDSRVLLFAGWLFLFATHWGAENTSYGIFLRENLHLNWQQVGGYFSVEYIAIGATVAFIGPKLREFTSWRGYIIAGLLCSGLGHIGMVTNIVLLSAAFRALHGIGDGVIIMIQYVGIARLFSIERIGGNNGLITTVLMLGYIVGSLVYGPVGEKFGYMHSLWISGALTLVLAIPFCFPRKKEKGLFA